MIFEQEWKQRAEKLVERVKQAQDHSDHGTARAILGLALADYRSAIEEK